MRRKRRKTIRGILILLLLFAIAVTVVLTIPLFNITSVTVTGNARLTAEEILAAAAVPTGKNIYRVSMKDARERLEAQPYILTAEVERRFPAKVVISVTERTEVATIKCTGGYAVIDKSCRVLRIAAEAESLPTVSGSTVKKVQPGENIVMHDDSFTEDVTTLFEALETADLQVSLRRIRLESSLNTVLETQHGLEIHLGGLDELPYKLQMCKNILYGGYDGINRESSGILKWTSEGQFSYRQSEN